MCINAIFGSTWIDVSALRIMAAITSFLLVSKLYDWLRLFESTAFYVQLLGATFLNIGWFMLLFLFAMLLFGLPMSMLNLSRASDEEQLINKHLFFWLFDVLYNQYLLSLGEFETLDGYTATDRNDFIIAMFVGATFFTQITMLNMLIAIMGDVFDQLTEQKTVSAISTKLEILADQAPMLALTSSYDEDLV